MPGKGRITDYTPADMRDPKTRKQALYDFARKGGVPATRARELASQASEQAARDIDAMGGRPHRPSHSASASDDGGATAPPFNRYICIPEE